MDRAELVALLTPEGLRLLDALPDVGLDGRRRARPSPRCAGRATPPSSSRPSSARRGCARGPRAKFGEFAERMLFTRAGPRAGDPAAVAARHAGRFRAPASSRVADLGCGIGGDALGLAALGLEVTAVDADEVTAAIAAYNLAPFPHGRGAARARRGRAARRHRRRLARPRPPHPAGRHDRAARGCRGLLAVARLGVRPGRPHARRHEARPGPRPRVIPDDAEAQWVSADGDVVELVRVVGRARPPGRPARRARDPRRRGARSSPQRPTPRTRPSARSATTCYEPDGAVIRARLIGDVARATGRGCSPEASPT